MSQLPSQTPSQSHSFEVFSQYSRFLRSAIADEESLQLGEELHLLAGRIEAMVILLQQPKPERRAVAAALIDLVESLRAHRGVVGQMGEQWRRFFEFDAHVSALSQFRTLVTAWALDATKAQGMLPVLADFDLAAWRFLGAGKLLLDVHDHTESLAADAPQRTAPPATWRGRWRAWWKGRNS